MQFIVRKCSIAFAGALLVTIASLGGCGAGTTSSKGELSSTPSEVGSVTAFDATVTFYSVTHSGKTEIGMRETGSAFAKRLLVAPLLAQGLTSQEIYLALAPPGAVAPPELGAAQADEAAAMRRSAELRHAVVDPS